MPCQIKEHKRHIVGVFQNCILLARDVWRGGGGGGKHLIFMMWSMKKCGALSTRSKWSERPAMRRLRPPPPPLPPLLFLLALNKHLIGDMGEVEISMLVEVGVSMAANAGVCLLAVVSQPRQ